MVKGWARDVAFALLNLNWKGTIKQIRAEFNRGGPSLYPQACDTISREGIDLTPDAGWHGMDNAFSLHSTTSGNSKKSNVLIFRHLDGDRKKNKGTWELLYYDKTWDEDFKLPEHTKLELYDKVGETILSNTKFTRSLIGLNFGDEPGLVYVVTNPVWPGWVKVGKTGSMTGRLSSYKTGDPYRRYKEEHSRFFVECGFAEKEAHAMLNKSKLVTDRKNEWFQTSIAEAIRIIDSV